MMRKILSASPIDLAYKRQGANLLLANNFITRFSCSYCFEFKGLPDNPVATRFFEEGEVTEIDVDSARARARAQSYRMC